MHDIAWSAQGMSYGNGEERVNRLTRKKHEKAGAGTRTVEICSKLLNKDLSIFIAAGQAAADLAALNHGQIQRAILQKPFKMPDIAARTRLCFPSYDVRDRRTFY